jgi:hypothetical protein
MALNLGEITYTCLPLLRSGKLRILIVGVPAVTTMAAIFTAVGPNPALGIMLSVVAGVIISSSLFIAVTAAAQEFANERVLFARNVEEEHWQLRAQRLFPRHRENGNLYADWYFRLRLLEELERAQRYNTPVTVLLAKKPKSSVRNGADGWPGSDVESYLRRTDLPAVLRDGSLGVILPHTAHYADVRRRITEALGSLDASIGLATFPKDGDDVSSLLRAADLAAEQNREHDARQRLAA